MWMDNEVPPPPLCWLLILPKMPWTHLRPPNGSLGYGSARARTTNTYNRSASLAQKRRTLRPTRLRRTSAWVQATDEGTQSGGGMPKGADARAGLCNPDVDCSECAVLRGNRVHPAPALVGT